MMIVKLTSCSKSRVKVWLDEEKPAFVLYEKEIKQYGLKEGQDLSDLLYAEILENVLIKRARNRALYLLADYGRTEWQLRKKLQEGFYPEEAINAAVDYVKEKHYLDDTYYAENFAENRTKRKSRKMVEQELIRRGIDRETITAAFENLEGDEKDTIRSLILKKYPDPEAVEPKDAQKLMRSLLSKGFRMDDCRAVMDETGISLYCIRE